MRLNCEVQVTNRLLPVLNLRKPGRSTYTQVSIGRKPGDKNKASQVFLMLCTAQNRNGTKYLLYKNVEQIFAKFAKEGKATIWISNPADSIAFSKADPDQLLVFLKLLRLACDGKECPEKFLSTLVPASAKQIEKPVTSLQVSTPGQYPMTFPKSLQKLTICNCSLRRISQQITALTELKLLDMSCNHLSSVPESFGQLVSLHTLNLSENQLGSFPIVLCNSDVSKCLASLDLRKNEIQCLPADISKMKSLHSLNISHNQIKRVPESMTFMMALRNFLMSDNRLEFLPGTLLTRMFETADFSNNPFCDKPEANAKSSFNFPVPTLAEISARSIVSHRIPYSSEDLDIISIQYLNSVHFCLCGKPCFEASFSQLTKRRVPSNVSYSQGDIPFLVYFCSRMCYSRFH